MTLLQSYTSREVADHFGISESTIRWYKKSGLISPLLPRNLYTVREGVSSVYKGFGPQHMQELRRILEMKEQNRTLRDMRDALHPEDDE